MSRPLRHTSPFRIILIMVTLMLIGAAMIPMLNIQYSPSIRQKGISVYFGWNGASARVVEQEVTSKIEGTLASLSGIQEMYSSSYKDGGSVSLAFKQDANMDAIRFEISSRLRQLYPSLPEGVSYPSLSTGMDGESASPVLTYTINADLPTWQIEQYTQEHIADPLSRIEGVNTVSVAGATPFEWTVTFDPNRCAPLGITGGDIISAFNTLDRENPIGLGQVPGTDTSDLRQIRIQLKQSPLPPEQWSQLIIKNIDGRIVRLGDIATIRHRQQLPSSYYRINGLNNINLTIYAERHVNTLVLTDALKARIEQIRNELPDGYSITLADDSSVYIRGELSKIYWRTGLSILILLLFVFLTSRSWRYLWMIVLTLGCNILVAFIFYNLFGLEIHLYSLAGITVSLGMIIDTSIIMIDHYGRFGNRRVFLAIMGALLTTIGALSIVLFLPEGQRDNLVNFCAVIVINLVVSMFISVLFIPALIDKFPIYHRARQRLKRFRTRPKRRVVRFTRLYGRFLLRSRRLRWIYIVVAILGFGLPVQLLPAKIEHRNDPKRDSTLWVRAYNATIGSDFYQQKAKDWVETALGGSLRLFAKDVYTSDFYSTPERTQLIIRASLPEGCTVHQLNETIRDMENFLSGFDEIDMFRTSISSYDNSQITVTFKPEADKAGFAYRLKDLATTKAISLGGADWAIYGVGQGFNNSLSSGWKQNQISLYGYNYEQLYRYAEELVDSISINPRVSEPEIMGRMSYGGGDNRTEFYLDLNFDRFALYELSPAEYYQTLSQQLYRNSLPAFYRNGQIERAVLVSSEADRFDAWHMENDILTVGSRDVKLSELGTMAKRKSGNNIYKYNQQYSLLVAFDFVGSYELASRFTDRQINRLKEELPVGYSVVSNRSWGWWGGEGGSSPYWLLVLVILIIYFICAVLFESLRQPLVIISMIPISFIGAFLTFYLFELKFDQGGFASFVLLSGLVVNAGIYLINDYNIFRRKGIRGGMTTYLRAYNRKIIPIMLTVLSTVLGLVPFVVISREPFWFSFAAGAMGGMVFSIIAILFYLPVFLPLKERHRLSPAAGETAVENEGSQHKELTDSARSVS